MPNDYDKAGVFRSRHPHVVSSPVLWPTQSEWRRRLILPFEKTPPQRIDYRPCFRFVVAGVAAAADTPLFVLILFVTAWF